MLLSVLAILAASYAFPLRAWLDQRSQLAELSEQRDALTEEVADLEASRELWDDPAYVRAQARERLNYVLPGEVGIVVLGTESTPPDEPVTGTLVPAATDGQEWWSTLVSAFVAVGTSPPGEAASDPAGPAPADDAEAEPGSSSGATAEEATGSGGTAQSAEDAAGDPGGDPGGDSGGDSAADSTGDSAGGASGGAGAGSP